MPDIKQILKRISALEMEFESWKSHYKDISEYIIPRKGRFLDRDTKPNDGKIRHRSIIDGTASRALRILAAGMQSGLTSPSRPWFRLGIHDKDAEQHPDVKYWLDQVQRKMLHIFQRSNLYTSTHSLYYELGAFGTAAMAIDSDYERVLRCYPYTAGEYYLTMGEDLRINGIFRIYWSTVRNVVNTYGIKKVSDSTKNMFENGNGDTWLRLVHVIEPNEDAIAGNPMARFKPWASLVFEHANHSGNFLSQSGYNSFPVMAPRWTVTGTDIYGHSPAMETLGDVRMLQKMQLKSLQALDKMVDPPMVGPVTMKARGANLVPGGFNYTDQAGQTFAPAFQINPDFKSLEYKIERVQQAIKEGFFADLFLMIANGPSDMTATEVVQRHEEKLLMLGPVIERIQPELLDLIIDRTFDLMVDAYPQLIPPVPEQIQGQPLEIEYISILAQAQKMVGVTAIEQMAGFVGNLAGVMPDAVDKFDQDEAVTQYGDKLGIPSKIIRSDEDAEAIRAERQKQIQAQQMLEQGQALAQGAKTLSDTDMGENNALNALMGQSSNNSLPPLP